MSAPAFQAAGTPAVAISSASAVVGWPAHQADDIGLLIVSGVYGNPSPYAAPAGWTEAASSPQSNSGGALNARLQVFWKRAASGAEGDATVADVAGDDAKICQILTFRGCVTSGDPIDATDGDAIGATSTSVTVPGSTTSEVDTLVVSIVAHNGIDSTSGQASNWDNSMLSGVAEITDVCTDTSIGYGIAAAAGACGFITEFDPTTATLASAATQARIVIALRTAAAAPITATLSKTLGALTCSAAATVRMATATANITLGALTATGRGYRVSGHLRRVHAADVTNPSSHTRKTP